MSGANTLEDLSRAKPLARVAAGFGCGDKLFERAHIGRLVDERSHIIELKERRNLLTVHRITRRSSQQQLARPAVGERFNRRGLRGRGGGSLKPLDDLLVVI